MSFFRVLLALLISGGIAYGLYRAVDGKGVERVVEAVRTEIESPGNGENSVEAEPVVAGQASDVDVTEQETADVVPVTPPENDDTAQPDVPAQEAVALAENVEPEAVSDNAAVAPEGTGDDQTIDGNDDTFAERTEARIADAMQQGIAPADQTDAEETVQSEQPADNDLPRILPLPSPPDAILPDEAQVPAALAAQQTALPAARIAAQASTELTDVLNVVSSGMTYAEARQILVDAGWIPRIPTEQIAGPDANEAGLIEAGYIELEGCKGDERPLCRFEFIDDDRRIAAVLTAGTGNDPSVIDAFLMNVRAE